MYPAYISGTWQFSGDWLGCYRLITEGNDVMPVVPISRNELCPVCESPDAIHLSELQPDYPLMYYCPECLTIYGWYVAKCPDCGGFIWNKGCLDGKVKCSLCDMEWNTDTVKEINEEDSGD